MNRAFLSKIMLTIIFSFALINGGSRVDEKIKEEGSGTQSAFCPVLLTQEMRDLILRNGKLYAYLLRIEEYARRGAEQDRSMQTAAYYYLAMKFYYGDGTENEFRTEIELSNTELVLS